MWLGIDAAADASSCRPGRTLCEVISIFLMGQLFDYLPRFFSVSDDIYIKLVGPGEPIRLMNSPAPDLKPSWSPDGRMVAFLRFSSQVEAGLFLVPALGGAERKLADINVPLLKGLGSSSLSWTPDGKWIAFGGRPTVNDGRVSG